MDLVVQLNFFSLFVKKKHFILYIAVCTCQSQADQLNFLDIFVCVPVCVYPITHLHKCTWAVNWVKFVLTS